MTTLHLGVIDVSYDHDAPKKEKNSAKTSNITTGDVAEILEDEYHVMEVFFQVHQEEVTNALVESITGAHESVLSGAPIDADPFLAAGDKIKEAFDDFITNKEMDALGHPGIPTKASLKGVDHRKKNRKGVPGRPSFVDTGLYLSSFRAWVD